MTTVIDIGAKFGNPVARIFEPWNPEVITSGITLKFLKETLPTGKIDLLCFGGGMDIHPSLYFHRNVASDCEDVPSFRDLFEIEVWKLCQKYSVPVLGICRGSQFVCAMSGGELIQDIGYGHDMNHKLTLDDGREIPMTTTHHQMMWPNKSKNYMLIAWKDNKRSPDQYNYDHSKIKDPDFSKEPEIVYFSKTNVLAVQGHPEYYPDMNCASVTYIRELVTKYLGVEE